MGIFFAGFVCSLIMFFLIGGIGCILEQSGIRSSHAIIVCIGLFIAYLIFGCICLSNPFAFFMGSMFAILFIIFISL